LPLFQLTVLSDPHFASIPEQARKDYEARSVKSPIRRAALRFYRNYIWLRNPQFQNHLLDRFLDLATRSGEPDLVVAGGDYTTDTAFIGVADDAAHQSVGECLGKLRARFGDRFHANMGDHELGKISMTGNAGGLRMESWRRATGDLGIPGFWERDLAAYKLVGIASSPIALPVLEGETLAEERDEWWRVREKLVAQLRESFGSLKPGQRVLLFCHDPTALPFLADPEVIGPWLDRIEHTILGHLHSPFVFWNSQIVAGIPPIKMFGHTVHRITRALNRARSWQPFRPVLCPSLAGIELLKDGGYLALELDLTGNDPVKITRHRIPRGPASL
jgi:hypothetical protein